MEMKGKMGVYLSKIRNESGEFEILQLLEKTLDTNNPEKGEVPIKLLGFGEISLVFEILTEKTKNLAFKRLPIFDSEEQVEKHIKGYNEYNRLLNDDLQIEVPPSDAAWVYADKKKKKISLYCIQDKISQPESIGNRIIHKVGIEDVKNFIQLILRETKKVWGFNKDNIDKEKQIGLDGQISNWVVVDYDVNNPHVKIDSKLIYIDTSTPMYRINGEDAMEGELFLKSAPSFMRWILKLFFLDEVLDRYYNWREVIIDLIANFHKEQLPEMIPDLLKVVNDFFDSEAKEFDIEPITLKEIDKYYKNDKMIWVLFQNFRRFDRFLKKMFRKKYDFYLPAKIKR
jgi:hypothetical protein